MIRSLAASLAVLACAAAGAAAAQTPAPTPPAPSAETPAQADARPTITSSIKALLANAETRAVVEKHLPGIGDHPARPQFENMTLAQVAPMSQGAITPEIIAAIDEDLKKLPAA